MISHLSKYAQTRLGHYLTVGVGVYVFELVVIIVAQAWGAGPVLAVGLSFWLGLLVSFGLQKFITFGDRRTHRRIIATQFIAYSLLVLFNFGFTLLIAHLLAQRVPAILSRSLALGITTIWNFYLYKTHIFKINGELIY